MANRSVDVLTSAFAIVSFLIAVLIAAIATPEVAAAAPSCGDTITGTVKLIADLDCSGTATSPALTLATRAKLDLGGKTVTCAPGGIGIALINQFSTVSNGKVTGCDIAVRVGGTGRHAVRKVRADGNDVGIAVGSAGNQLTDNRVTSSDIGIALAVGADGSRVERNLVTGSQNVNILVDSDRNSIKTNTASDSVAGSGIAITGDRNKLVGNITASNGAGGVEVLGSFHNKSFHTTATGNDRGIAVHAGALQSEISQTKASGNAVADLFDDNPGPPCESHWVRNRTATTTVGGAGAACIE